MVLSSQRVDLKDALFTAGKDKEQAANPLVQDGQKLIPSVTRVFSRSRDMYVYLQAYEPGAAEVKPLVAFVTFYRGRIEGLRDPAAAGDRSDGQSPEDRSAAIQPRTREAAGRPVYLPGDGGGPGRAKSGVLAGARDAGAIAVSRC